MFRLTDRLRRLEKGETLSFRPVPDADGYVDKECPSPDCLFAFKVHADDWANVFRDEAVFCPLCRHEATSDKWWTTEQIRAAKQRAKAHLTAIVGEELDESLSAMAREFNQSAPRRGLVSISMSYRPGVRSRAALDAVLKSRDEFAVRLVCEECGARTAVVGSAFFCAACGHSGAERLFDDALAKVRLKVTASERIRAMLEAQGERDDGVILARSLVETGLSDCVVALQRLAERLYARFPGRPAPPQNAFQRLLDLDRLWHEAAGEGLGNWLDSGERARLALLFQRRHLLAHTDGIVDATYLIRSGDGSYKVGQRVVVTGSDVLELVGLVDTIAGALRRLAPM